MRVSFQKACRVRLGNLSFLFPLSNLIPVSSPVSLLIHHLNEVTPTTTSSTFSLVPLLSVWSTSVYVVCGIQPEEAGLGLRVFESVVRERCLDKCDSQQRLL